VLVATSASNGLYSFAGLPLPGANRRRLICIDLSPSSYNCPFGPWAGRRSREMLISRLQGWALGDFFMQPGAVELMVPSEEVKDKLDQFLGTDSRFWRRKVFVVKVRESTPFL